MNHQRVMVVGGGGFIGRPLVRQLLAAGAQVRVAGLSGPAPEEAEFVTADVRDPQRLRHAVEGAEVVFSLAAAHGLKSHSPDDYRDINVAGARHLCEAASANGVRRIVFTSTADVYGPGPFFAETTTPRPAADYGRTKLAAESVYSGWAAQDPARSVVIVRPTVVFGPGGAGAADRFIRHVAGPDYTHYGEAGNRRSLAYVENLAAFLAFLAEGPPGVSIFNYADAPDLTVAEITTIVRTALGLPAAPRRSLAGAYAARATATLRSRLFGAPRPAGLPLLGMVRQLSLERRVDASLAHRSGFVAPAGLREALALTARADARWVALLSRARA